MKKIAICDDENFALHVIGGAIEKVFSKYQPKIYKYNSLGTLKIAVKEEKFDLLFLDVQFASANSGIEFAKQLRKESEEVNVVFISGHENKVFDAFEVQPICFIRKSSFLNDLEKYAALIGRTLEAENDKNYIIALKGQTTVIKIKDIVYVEGVLKKQYLYTTQEVCYEVSKTMKQIETDLTPYDFIRIHSGYIVNCAYIQSINPNEVTLKNGCALPISRSRFKEVKDSFFKYIESKNK